MKPTLLALLLAVLPSSLPAAEPIALHPDNPHYFLFRGKPTILVGSTEHYGAVLNLDFDYIKYLDEIARHGLNLTRTFSGTYREIPESFNITDNTLAPKPGRFACPWAQKEGKFDLSRFDDDYFKRLKDFVAQAGQRGIVVEYVLFCTLYNDALWAVNPMNPANNTSGKEGLGGGGVKREEVFTLKHPRLLALQEALVKKAVQELNDFDNVYFEIINEPYFAGPTDQWQARIAQVIAEAERDLPRRHLVAQNIANDKKKVEKVTPHVSILNFHYATPPETVEMNYAHGLPISDDETGFRGSADATYRTEGWDFFIAGGAAYNNLDYSFTPAHPAGTLADYKSPGGGSVELRKQLAILKRFFDEMDFIHMKPANAVIRSGSVQVPLGSVTRSKTDSARAGSFTARALACEGKTYAIYLRGGTSATIGLDLPAGEYTAQWLSTTTGQYDKSESFAHKGGPKDLTSPAYVEDAVLRVVRK